MPGLARRIGAALSVLALTACGLGEGAVEDDGAQVTLRFALYISDQNVYYQEGAEPFKGYVEEHSGGEIAVELYPAEQLGNARDSLAMLRSGIADLAFTIPTYEPELRYSTGWELPLGMDTEQIVEGRWASYHEDGPLAEQYRDAGVVPLVTNTGSPFHVSSTSRPLPDLESVRGLRIRTGSDIHMDLVERLGANAVEGASSEQFEQLDRDIVNGTVFHYGGYRANGLDTLLGHSAPDVPLPPPAQNTFMSQETWEGLSEEHRRIVYEAGRRVSEDSTTASIAESDAELDAFTADGFSEHTWPQEDLDRVDALFADAPEQWAEDLGGDAGGALEQIEQLGARTDGQGPTELEADFESFRFPG
ncbi:TRAP transporter substrate-binding protein DctP [Nocardiopsis sp. HNM0947]|uniref:TRAP transporter substrate-binding protein DctP n=1 Tax=Nocardiopsis coralli TaxID=2772213 RepID=A0ABR9P357_9ACTN|nr:TRAP transporter substrate-binding protein DctP [Nocardiopsis coralli]MBE2998277.1 TRAP transporter substrate-binding protein DctP [Nocardiopsis coralli]